MERKYELKEIELSNCEKIILGCVYEYHNQYGEAPNLRDVIKILEKKYKIEWKLQTVCTFFSRIEKKGLLTIMKKGRFSFYSPVMSYEAYMYCELMAICKMYFRDDIKLLKKFVRKL